MNAIENKYINETVYEAPEYGTIEEYLEEARNHPDHLNEIVAAAVNYENHSVQRFVEEFGFDVKIPILKIEEKSVPVINNALRNCNVDEIKYLISLDVEFPENTLDELFDGRGSYYTWWGNLKGERTLEIEKVIEAIGFEFLAGEGFKCSDWWFNDFMEIIDEEIDEENEITCTHPYMNSAPIVGLLFAEYALSKAVNINKPHIVSFLLEHGWEITEEDLKTAICNSNLEMVKILAKAKKNGLLRKNDKVDTPLVIACKMENPSLEIVRALIEGGEDVNEDNIHGETPLLIASENGHLEIVRELIKAGVDVNHVHSNPECYGNITALESASKFKEVVEELRRAGAKDKAIATQVDIKKIKRIVRSIRNLDVLEFGWPEDIRADMEYEGESILEITVYSLLGGRTEGIYHDDGDAMRYFLKALKKSVPVSVWETLNEKVLQTLVNPLYVDPLSAHRIRKHLFDEFVEENNLCIRADIFAQLFGVDGLDKIKNVDWTSVKSYTGKPSDMVEEIIEDYWNDEVDDQACIQESARAYFKSCVRLLEL